METKTPKHNSNTKKQNYARKSGALYKQENSTDSWDHVKTKREISESRSINDKKNTISKKVNVVSF